MNALQVTSATAIAEYKKADPNGKKLMEKLFGKDALIGSIMDRVKTLSDALKIHGKPSKDIQWLLDYNGKDEVVRAAQKWLQATIICKVLNEGWKPNWKDTNEYKYYPWFYMDKAGVGFSYYGCDYGHSSSAVGSRLCFKSSELAEYAGKQFLDIYKGFMTF